MTKIKFMTNVAICTLAITMNQSTFAVDCLRDLFCCGCGDKEDDKSRTSRKHEVVSPSSDIEEGHGRNSPTTPLLQQFPQDPSRSMGSLDTTPTNPLLTAIDSQGDGGLQTPVKRVPTSPLPKASPRKPIAPSKTLTSSDRATATPTQQQLIAFGDRVKFSEEVWQILGKEDNCARAILDTLNSISVEFSVHAVISKFDTGKCRLDITETSSQRQYSKIVNFQQ